MELTRKQVIKNLNALNAVCGQKDFYDKEMEESMRYAISSLKTDEAYQIMYEGGEIFTKADMEAMLEELKKEMNPIKECEYQIYGKEQWNFVGKCQDIIQQKINTLNGENK